jgi:argininosuccinate lyase
MWAKNCTQTRSRNDQVGTDIRLYLRQQIDDIRQEIRNFQQALVNHAENHLETLIPGYTHLQRAQPISLAHHLLAYFQMAERDQPKIRRNSHQD